MISNKSTLLIGAILAAGLLPRDMGLGVPAPAQTNAVDPDAPVPQPESRQVRRARERREAKEARRT